MPSPFEVSPAPAARPRRLNGRSKGYLIGTSDGVQHFTEPHEMSLFSHEEYAAAFEAAGLGAAYDAEGLMGRGLYIGVRPD